MDHEQPGEKFYNTVTQWTSVFSEHTVLTLPTPTEALLLTSLFTYIRQWCSAKTLLTHFRAKAKSWNNLTAALWIVCVSSVVADRYYHSDISIICYLDL